VRTAPVFGRWDWLAWGVLSLAHVAVLATAVRGITNPGALGPTTWLLALVLVPSVLSLGAYEARWLTLPLQRRPLPRRPRPGLRVAAVTTFVPGLESIAMLRRTVQAMVAMDYPHDAWVLDEGDDPEVRELCGRLGARHFSRRGHDEWVRPQGTYAARTKHGNYNAWLAAVGYEHYDVLANFDPDHVPRREFLERTLGHLRDPAVGYVQAPQTYYNQEAGLVARGAAEETYTYYSSVQQASFALGYPIVTGCHTVQRLDVLRMVGGFAAHDADDLLITLRYRAAGVRGVYLPEPLAWGITPADWTGYLRQQRRWARSVLDVKIRHYPALAHRLPPTERVVGLLHGLYYLHGLGTALALGTLGVMGVLDTFPPFVAAGLLPTSGALLVVLLASDVLRQRFYLRGRAEWGLHWRAGLLRFAKWPVVLLAAVEALGGRQGGYATTPKTSGRGRAMAPGIGLHAAAVVWLSGCAAVALWRDSDPPAVWWALVIAAVTCTLLVVALQLRGQPPAYDDDLAHRRLVDLVGRHADDHG